MQGPSHLDLARTLANEHLETASSPALRSAPRPSALRGWVGRQLITLGERLEPRPTELQLRVSTGPPCP
jgi:hypothetical protein